MAHTLPVKTPGGTYDIHVGHGVRAQLGTLLAGRHAAIATNPTIAALYEADVRAALPAAAVAYMPDSEADKTLTTVESLCRSFAQSGLDRSSVVVAFGGGVVGDTAGFAAASYMRGVSLLQVPTTLLAMVDSSVGGKVGVDLPDGKNLVGAFKQPEAVLIDPDYLATLPPKEWRCGMAEVIKHGFLADPLLLDPVLWQPERAEDLIRRAVQVKIDVVEQDPYEKGVRAHLNLGHTFAHAIEAVTHYAWAHGEAVGFGLVCAARLSQHLGLCDADFAASVEDVVAEVGLPTRSGGLDADALWAAMATDKKWQSGRSRFVLLNGPQQPVIVESVPRDAVVAVLRALV